MELRAIVGYSEHDRAYCTEGALELARNFVCVDVEMRGGQVMMSFDVLDSGWMVALELFVSYLYYADHHTKTTTTRRHHRHTKITVATHLPQKQMSISPQESANTPPSHNFNYSGPLQKSTGNQEPTAEVRRRNTSQWVWA